MTEIIDEVIIAEPKGKVEDINKLKNVIRFILNNVSSTKYKTELIKLCFIVDYQYSKEKHKQNPTTVKYVRYNYGPYSDYFVEAFQELIKEKTIIEVSLPYGIGYNSISKDSLSMEQEIKDFILSVLKIYGKMSLKEMKEYIYNLPEFKQTEFGQEILINNAN